MGIFLLALLYAVAARAFLFEIKFERIRVKLANKHRLFDTFLSCPFCNGFWTGLISYLILVWHPVEFSDIFTDHTFPLLYFSVATGFLGWLQEQHTKPWNS